MQNRPNHRFDRTDQRPAQASEVGDNTSNDDNPNIDSRTTCDTAPKASATEHVSSVLPLNCTGSQTQLKGATGVTVETHRRRKSAMSLYALDRHKRICRILGYALTVNDPSIWNTAGLLLGVHLTLKERFSLIFVLLAEATPDERKLVFEAFHDGQPDGAGVPIALLFDLMDEATFWASMASQRELKAYALACFEAMRPKVQAAFLAHVQRGAVA